MENAVVTFKDKDSDKEIKISLQYDKETSNLDYDVEMSSEYNANTQMDFIGFLADMFLNLLQLKDTN